MFIKVHADLNGNGSPRVSYVNITDAQIEERVKELNQLIKDQEKLFNSLTDDSMKKVIGKEIEKNQKILGEYDNLKNTVNYLINDPYQRLKKALPNVDILIGQRKVNQNDTHFFLMLRDKESGNFRIYDHNKTGTSNGPYGWSQIYDMFTTDIVRFSWWMY